MHQVNLIDDEKFYGKHNTFGNLLLQPGVNHTDTNRGQMFSSHIEQAIQIDQPNPPLWFTRFEDQWSKYSSGYLELDGKWKVLVKINKNDYNYVMIVKKIANSKKEKIDMKNGKEPKFKVGTYHVIFRTEAVWLTEKYGYKYNNEIIDSLEKGDVIEDEILYKDKNRDEDMNFQYGRNLNAVYLSYAGLTTEDACVVSKSVTEKMASYFVKKIQVSLNTNDILTNMYGNKEFYKAFPDIGEEIKGGLLCSSRRIHYQTAPISLSNMMKPRVGDTSYRAHGKVIDIKVISNIDNPDEELEYNYNKQIKKYYKEERNYYKNFIKYVEPIVSDKKLIVSSDLVYYYNRYKMLMDPKNKFRVDKNLFDHLIIEFMVFEKSPLVVGSKLAGRYGRK